LSTNQTTDTSKPPKSPSRNNRSTTNRSQGQPVPQEPQVVYVNFKLLSSDVHSHFITWKSSVWLAPTGFSTDATLTQFDQILVPHWLFNVDCTVKVNAKVYRLVIDINNKAEKYDWLPISETKHANYKDILALGTETNALFYNLLVESVKDWDVSTLLQKEQSAFEWFVNGFRRIVGTDTPSEIETTPPPKMVSIESIPWRVCFDRHCRKYIEEMEIEAAKNSLKLKGHEILKDVSVVIENLTENFKATQVYLPIFICHYKYDGEHYGLIVNGKNGKVVGDRPYGMIGKLLQAGSTGMQLVENLFWGGKK